MNSRSKAPIPSPPPTHLLVSLQNDGLRKRVDSLKYDAKKIESVVYDLSIRGLLKDA